MACVQSRAERNSTGSGSSRKKIPEMRKIGRFATDQTNYQTGYMLIM